MGWTLRTNCYFYTVIYQSLVFTRKLSFWNLPSILDIRYTIWDFTMPSVFSTDKSHSIPVPQSTSLIIGTLALITVCTPSTGPAPTTQRCKSEINTVPDIQWRMEHNHLDAKEAHIHITYLYILLNICVCAYIYRRITEMI